MGFNKSNLCMDRGSWHFKYFRIHKNFQSTKLRTSYNGFLKMRDSSTSLTYAASL